MNVWGWVVCGAGFTFLMTCAGAGVVLFTKKELGEGARKVFLGFAAGVMIAASVWSLLIPAIEEAEARGQVGWIPAAGGFALGVAFLFGLDKLIPHLHQSSGLREGPKNVRMRRTTLLVLAVTLHNIPEGMAVGLTFAFAAQGAGGGLSGPEPYVAAIATAVGIGIQDFPEGAVISLPLRQEGKSRARAFLTGTFSGVPEFLFALLAVALAPVFIPVLPWLLASAAGAMMYVVVEELIPESHLGEHSEKGTVGVLAGFLLMMVLDVALG